MFALALDAIFWLLVIELFVFFGIASANDKEMDGLAALLSIFGVVLAFWLTATNPVVWFTTNFGTIILGALGWAVVGAATAAFKWFTTVNSPEVQASIKEAHAEWTKAWSDNVPDKTFTESHQFKPFTVSANVGNLIRWAVYWPMTLTWMVTYRFVRWASIKLYEAMRNIYEWILYVAVNRALK